MKCSLRRKISFRHARLPIASHNKVKHDRRLYGAAPISLNETTIPESDGLARGDLIAEDKGLAVYFGQPADAFAAAGRLDLERGLRTLDPVDRALCASLTHTTVDRLAASGHGARSNLYRRVRNIRLALLAVGLTACDFCANHRP